MPRAIALLSRLVLVLAISLAVLPAPSEAQETPALPEVGTVVIEDPLSAAGLVTAGDCPSGRNVGRFVPEGFLLKVTGKCSDTSVNAVVTHRIKGLTVPDGEVRFELRQVSGVERGRFRLWFRDQASNGNDAYFLAFTPALGALAVIRLVDRQSTTIAERTDLVGMYAAQDWISIAVRTQGPNIWVLINDQPVITTIDVSNLTGSAALDVQRSGEPNDESEAAFIIRNLRISGLAGGDVARQPSYQAPAAPPVAAPPAPVGDPWVGDIKFGYEPSESDAVPSGGKLPIIASGTIYGFFSWRNLPPGTKLRIDLISSKEVYFGTDYAPGTANGRTRVAMVHWEGGGGGNVVRTNLLVLELVLGIDGQEKARGWVQPGG